MFNLDDFIDSLFKQVDKPRQEWCVSTYFAFYALINLVLISLAITICHEIVFSSKKYWDKLKIVLTKKRKIKKVGFTLAELLIVIVILGVLAGVVVQRFTGASKDAKEASLKANLSGMRSQLEIFKARSSSNVYPSSLGELVTESYMERIPIDPFYKNRTEYIEPTGPGIGGWVYDNSAGKIHVNIMAGDPVGAPVDTSWGLYYSTW